MYSNLILEPEMFVIAYTSQRLTRVCVSLSSDKHVYLNQPVIMMDYMITNCRQDSY